MAESQTLEERVTNLEQRVNQLTREFQQTRAKPGWVRQVLGSMMDDPDFLEILKLGQEIRQADRAD